MNNFPIFIQEQALKHLKQYIQLFSAFTSSAKSELVLLNKIQVHSQLCSTLKEIFILRYWHENKPGPANDSAFIAFDFFNFIISCVQSL